MSQLVTGDITESITAFTAADYDIEARVNIQGVELDYNEKKQWH